MKLKCTGCGQIYPLAFHPFCDKCGSMTDVEYDLTQVRLLESKNPYFRFRHLLPVHDQSLLPKDTLYTPLIHAKHLGAKFGLKNLYIKNETVNPTATTKDRMAAIALAYLFESGVKTFCASSTGNSSSAFAKAIKAFPEMHMYLFTAENWQDRVQFADHDQVTHFVIKDETFVGASLCSTAFAKRNNIVAEAGFFNPGRREGLKLAFFEASEQVEEIEYYVQAVSSAMGVYGTYKGAQDLYQMGLIKQMIKPICVQQESCCPMVKAWHSHSESIRQVDIFHQPRGLAMAILRGDPSRSYPYIYRMLKESGGDLIAVNSKQIRIAKELLKKLENFDACFSASTAVAGVIQNALTGKFLGHEKIVINLTGKDRQLSRCSGFHYLIKDKKQWLPEDKNSQFKSLF